MNLLRFAKFHKSVSGASFAITGSAEAGNVVEVEQPTYNLDEGATVGEVELCGVFLFALLGNVTTYAGARATAYLRNSKLKDFFSALGTLACGDYHACVGNGYSDDGHNAVENFVGHAVLEVGGVDVIGHAQTGTLIV